MLGLVQVHLIRLPALTLLFWEVVASVAVPLLERGCSSADLHIAQVCSYYRAVVSATEQLVLPHPSLPLPLTWTTSACSADCVFWRHCAESKGLSSFSVLRWTMAAGTKPAWKERRGKGSLSLVLLIFCVTPHAHKPMWQSRVEVEYYYVF